MHPTAADPHGVVTRQPVVPGPPIFVPHVEGAAAPADRDVIVTISGAAHAATTAWRRNLLRERPSSDAAVGAIPMTLGETEYRCLSVLSALIRAQVPPFA